MWVRKRIDIGWSGLVSAACDCLRRGDFVSWENLATEPWRSSGRYASVPLSVRSGLDAFLTSVSWEPGDEVVMSALTIPDMPRIVRKHGLLPVPLDVEPKSMNVSADRLEEAITPRTRAVIIAHLFGGRVPLEPLAEVCRRHSVLLIEDCAQAFTGYQDAARSPADLSMFSFGPIKTHTALIGSVFTSPHEQLIEGIRRVQAQWPVQSSSTYFKRTLKYGFVKGLSIGWVAGSVATALRWMGRDHDRLATNMARGFAGGDFFAKIRQRPSVAILRTLARRFAEFDRATIERRQSLGRRFIERVGDRITVLGASADNPTFWVLPIVVENSSEVVSRLWRSGFDATCSSSLQAIPAPADRPQLEATVGRSTLDATIFLPFHHRMPARVVDQMADIVRATASPVLSNEARKTSEGSLHFSASRSLSRSSS